MDTARVTHARTTGILPSERLRYLLVWLNVHSNLLRLIKDGRCGGMGTYVLTPTRYPVTTRMTLH